MSYLKEIKWTVSPLTVPTVKKSCSKCGQHATFINSEKFRVNANKNKIDVWLIYQCNRCKSTWNMAIYERITPRDIPAKIYQAFLENDTKLAWCYGFNKGLHMKHKVTLDYENIDYIVEGDSVESLVEINEPYEEVVIKLICSQPMDLRIDKLLSHKLQLSRNQVKKLCHQNIISTGDNANILKDKIQDGTLLRIKVKKV